MAAFTRAISFKADLPAEAGLEYARVVHEPDAGRVAFVADLAAAWVRLRRKPRAERKLAVLLSDYPNRAGRTGYACGLDTPESVAEVLSALGASGYAVGAEPVEASNLIARPRRSRAVGDDRRSAGLVCTPSCRPAAGNPRCSRKCVGHARKRSCSQRSHFRFPCVRRGMLSLPCSRIAARRRPQIRLSRSTTPTAARLCRALRMAAGSGAHRCASAHGHARHARNGCPARRWLFRTPACRKPCSGPFPSSIPSSSTTPARRCRPSGASRAVTVGH